MLCQCDILLYPHCWRFLTVAWAQRAEFHGRSSMNTKCLRSTSIIMLLPLQSISLSATKITQSWSKCHRSYSSSLYKWTQYPRLDSVLGLLHLYQHHFPWLRSDKSGIDILRGPPHPVWLCTSGVLLPEYPHYCWCCMNTSGWTLPALIYTVCIKYKVTDVKI